MKATILLFCFLSSCVHTQIIKRNTHIRLGVGEEGYAPVITFLPKKARQAATLTLHMGHLNYEERRSKHLLRKASLLGCDAVYDIQAKDSITEGICIVYEK